MARNPPPFILLIVALSASASQPIEFNRDIRPILSDKCFTCHGPDAANRKTKLRFDLESGALMELREGKHAIVAGDPDHSEMFRRVSSTDKVYRMPPAYMGRDKLSDKEIQLIRDWIQQGAKWTPFWSFIPPQRPPCPWFKRKAGCEIRLTTSFSAAWNARACSRRPKRTDEL